MNPKDKVNQAIQESMRTLNQAMLRQAGYSARQVVDQLNSLRPMSMTAEEKEMLNDAATLAGSLWNKIEAINLKAQSGVIMRALDTTRPDSDYHPDDDGGSREGICDGCGKRRLVDDYPGHGVTSYFCEECGEMYASASSY